MRSAVIEIGGTTTRAVVAEPAPDARLAIRLDRRIVLRLQQAVDRDGSIGEGLRLLVTETVVRLQAECFRAGVPRPALVVAADLLAAGDLDDLVGAVHRRTGEPVTVRSDLDEAALLLAGAAVDGDVVVAAVGDRAVRFVERVGDTVAVTGGAGPAAVGGARRPRHAPPRRLDGVRPLTGQSPVVTGPVTTAVVRALWARNGRGADGPARADVHRDGFAALERELLALSPTQRLLLPAVAPEDVDLVVLGAGYLHALARQWGVDHVLAVATSPAEAHLHAVLAAGRGVRA